MWELVSFAKSKTRKICLEVLKDGPKTPSYILKSSGEYLLHISRALSELEEKYLIKCLTPNRNKNRIYGITTKGLDVLSKLEKIN